MSESTSTDDAELVASLAGDLDHATQRLLGLYDVPAYVRRALRVEEAILALEKRIEQQRVELLLSVRQALARWEETNRKYPSSRLLLDESTRRRLQLLAERLPAHPSIRTIPLLWPVRPKRIWRDLSEAVRTFNRKWNQWIAAVDLGPVNRLIDDYNKHYLVEKECAFRSVRAASRHFQPMKRIERQEFVDRYPPLAEIDS
jgi:hypothetical protein